jgi:2-(1,2-epoxy-1,2-dihydrophenyl)acetyl-CoA isomerase
LAIESSDLGDAIRLIKMSGKTATQSFSRQFLPQIATAINAALVDKQVKAIVLTGEGKFFSAGANIDDFKRSIDEGNATELIRELTGILHPLIVKMRQSSTICVAALNGASAGGGLGLALACDARVATAQAIMAASYAGIGLSPDGGTTWLLPRLVTEQVARRFFLENKIWSAQQATELGAIDAIVKDEELISAARQLAKRWSSWGEHSKESIKHLLYVQSTNDFETHLKHERTLIEASGRTAAFKEGVSAFLEKREAKFD